MFHYDNAFFRFMRKVVDALFLNLLFLISCIPIFTIGAASSAMYYTICKVLRENRGYIGQEYIKSFKENFKQGTILWGIVLIVGIILLVDIKILGGLSESDNPLKWGYIVFLFFLAFFVVWCQYLFAQLARFSNTTKQILINSVVMTLVFLPKNILLIVLSVLSLAVMYVFPFFVFFVPVVYMMLETAIMEKVFLNVTEEE